MVNNNCRIDTVNKWYLIGYQPNKSINQIVGELSNGNFEADQACISLGTKISNPQLSLNQNTNEVTLVTSIIIYDTGEIKYTTISEPGEPGNWIYTATNQHGLFGSTNQNLTAENQEGYMVTATGNPSNFKRHHWGRISNLDDQVLQYLSLEENTLTPPDKLSLGVWILTKPVPEPEPEPEPEPA